MKKKINWKNVLGPNDSITLVVVVLGLLLVVFIDELAIKIIGGSVMLLGIVALVMLISSRMNDIVDTNKFKPSTPAPNYHVTVKKDTSAKRITIENFEATFPDDGYGKAESETQIPRFDEPITGEEGFRIVKKISPDEVQKIKESRAEETITEPIAQTTYKEATVAETPLPVKADVVEDFGFEEDFSGMRIVGKIPSEKPVVPQIPVTEKDEPAIEKESFEEEVAKEQVPIQPEIRTVVTPEIPKVEVRATEFAVPAEKKEADFKEKQVEVPLSLLLDDEPVLSQEPRKEFQFFISRVLMVIRSVITAKTSAFIMYNAEKNELVLESFATDVPDSITKKYKFPVRSDIISQIVLSAKPEILTEINPSAELELVPYYVNKVGTSSFVGIPIFYDSAVIGLLCADSDMTDAYDSNTISFLGQFSKLIGSLLKSYIDKHDLLQSSRTLDVINAIASVTSRPDYTIEEITSALLEASSNLFEYTTIGVCCFDETLNGWKVIDYKTKDTLDEAVKLSSVPLDSTLLGKALAGSKTVWQAPVDEKVIRFHPKEIHQSKGYFIACPLKSKSSLYGALFLEGKSPTNMT
ncbi:MAG: GAF domain-containing protein, partial [Bacteroidota bacterium]